MTLRRRPTSSHWWYDFWYRGRRYRGSTRLTSKLRAHEYERRLIQELEAGRDPFFRSAPLQDLLSQYLAWLEVNRSAQHVERSRRAIGNVLKRMPRAAISDDITPSKIEDFKKRRLREVSASTVNLELRHFKAFLKRCVKQGWLNRVPVEIEKVKTPSRGRLVFLSENEIAPFLENLRPWAKDAARLILLTGLRLDEARFLEWQDIDLETGELWVRNKPELGFSPKNGKERVVALPPELIEELRLEQEEKGWVLRGKNGGQLDRRTFQDAVAAAGKAAGLSKRITPHVLRHTYGSHLVMRGVDIQTVKDLMGHSSITTTAIYLHTDPKHRREAVAKLKLPVGKEGEEKVIPFRG
jgi:integrase